MNNVSRHAVNNYLNRVLNITVEQASPSIRELAREQIRLAMVSPELVYQEEDEDIPIHIRNGCAIPVGQDEGPFVPTTYDDRNFLRKMRTLD